MVNLFTAILLSCFVFGSRAWGPTDCAFSVWSEWTTHRSGAFQLRTREIIRHAREGGRPCTGETIQYRAINSNTDPGPAAFLSMFLAGNVPSYSLGGGRFYTLSRDFVVLLDKSVEPVLFPYYKSLVSNLLGKVCGEFGNQADENQVTMVTFDTAHSPIHGFTDDQVREVLQDKALKFHRSQYSNIVPAADFARRTLLSDYSGTRRYNNATKEVLLVTSYSEYCSRGLHRALNRLRTAAQLYILVIGKGAYQDRPSDWCFENLASTPTEFHFRQLKDVTDISQVSSVLLDQFPVNLFCGRSTGSLGRISTALLSGAASPRRLAEDTQQAPSPSHIILTPGRPVAALTPIAERQATFWLRIVE